MRTNHGLHKISLAFLVAPMLASCGNANVSTTDGGTGAVTLPDCADGSLLGTDASGTLVCKSAPQGQLNYDNCTSGMALNSNGSKLSCVALGTGQVDNTLQANIDKASMDVDNLITKANNSVGSGGATAVWVGNTPNATKGQIQHAGNPDGIIAAAATCNDAFAGSHMCTIFEMYNTAVQGKLKMTDTIAKAWIYAPAHNEPIGTPSNANLAGGGEADNCGSYTYPTADRVWTGTAVEWKILPTGGVGFVFSSGGNTTAGTSAYCHDPLPIACCK